MAEPSQMCVATIAERMKQAMELREMKQTDLCRLTGIGKSSISTYLSGEYEPKQKNIYLIARALEVNEAWLMGLDVDEAPRRPLNKMHLKTEEETEREFVQELVKFGDEQAIGVLYRLYTSLSSTSRDYTDEEIERLVRVACKVLSTSHEDFDRVEGVINALLK